MTREVARYTRDGSSRAAGSVVYDDDTVIHTHSDTAPTRGQLNAFDLVRIEKFGHLDVGDAANLPMGERPSYKAMAEMMDTLPEIRAPRAATEFEDLGELEPAVNDDAWLEIGIAAPSKRKRFQPYSAREYMARPPLEYIVQDVLPRGELTMVLGDPGTGKTFFSLDMAAAITRGVDWCGRAVRKGRVVYLVLEGSGGFSGRLRAYAQEHGVDPDDLPQLIDDAPNLIEPKDAAALAAAIDKADVVFVDTLSCAHDGNENTGEDMGRVLASLKFLHKQTGATCVLIHHPPKSGDGARGWSGLTGAADAIITITKQGDVRSAATTKLKDGVEGALFNFRINPAGVFELAGGIAAKSVRLPTPGTKLRVAYDVLHTLAPTGTVDLNDLRAAIAATKLEPESGQRDRRKQRATEEIEELIRKKLAFMQGEDRISLTALITGGDFEAG